MALDALLQSHESRIGRLEEATKEVGEAFATLSERLDGLGARVTEGNLAIGDKLDRLSTQLENHTEHAQALAQKLEALETEAHHKENRKAKLQKAIWMIATGIGGALLKHLHYYLTH